MSQVPCDSVGMRRIAWVALALAGCADPWAGSYAGTEVSEARDCDTGERFGPFTNDTTVTIERGGDGLFINGRCLFTLDELSDRSAVFRASECDTTLEDGTPVHYELVSGRAELEGDRLVLMYAADIMTPGGCLFSSATFSGFRE